MNVTRIQTCADRIADNERALRWLTEFGSRLDGRNDAATVAVTLRDASACPGAKEAEKVLSAYAKLSLPGLVEQATRACLNTIAMDRDAIREELDRPDPAEDAAGEEA